MDSTIRSTVDIRTPEYALEYACRGWAVLPLHSVSDAVCSCRDRASCPSAGKHPRTRYGVKEASTDVGTIRGWWDRWPDANVGIACGAISGNVVLDVDPRNGGDKSMVALVGKLGRVPKTATVLTGGGGGHLYFSYPGNGLKFRKDAASGVNIQADRRYVVAPNSLHETGRRYSWQIPPDRGLAQLPPAWLDHITHPTNGVIPPTCDTLSSVSVLCLRCVA
jgi:hypothetical protein